MATSYFYATQTKSWRNGGWRTDNSRIYQGRYTSVGSNYMHTGVCWFNAASIKTALTGQVVDSVRLRLSRTTGGIYAARPIYMGRNTYATSLASAPGARDGYTNIASLAVDTTTWITLANKFAEGFRDNGDTCFVFYTTDTTDNGYAIMEGAAGSDGMKPYLEITYHPAATAPTAPTKVTLSPGIFENTGAGLTMAWSGATGGINNAIQGYTVYNYVSSDNVNWRQSSWNVNTTSGSYSNTGATSTVARGEYFRIRVVTRGATMNSGFSAYSNTVRCNTFPKAPTSFTASPSVYSTENITLSWSGAVAGTSSISKYTIEYSTSANGSTWGSWTALTTVSSSATSGSHTVSPTRTVGTYTRYRIRVTDTMGALSDTYTTSGNVLCNITACGAPTTCSLNATLAEGNVILMWSGAASGAGNTINAYQIQYRDSADNATWGAWVPYTVIGSSATNGSTVVTSSPMRGTYRQYRMLTQGSAGSGYFSGWRVSSNSVRRNTLPYAPGTFLVSPAVYQSGAVTLTWSGASGGTSAIKSYLIQEQTSSDNSSWSAYTNLVIMNTTAASGSYTYVPGTMAAFTRYRICATDTLNCTSGYVYSVTVRKNNPPPVPAVTAPKNRAITYNVQPRVLITLGAEPDGERQMLCVKTADGAWLDSVNNPSSFSVSGWLGDRAAVTFHHNSLTPGTCTISVKAKDESVLAESGELSRSFTVAASPFTEIIPNETQVKAEHINILRTAVNNVRNYYGMAACAWREEIIPGRTQIKNWPSHITELRRAVDEIISTFDLPPVAWIPIEIVRPQAAVMNQLQDLILSL